MSVRSPTSLSAPTRPKWPDTIGNQTHYKSELKSIPYLTGFQQKIIFIHNQLPIPARIVFRYLDHGGRRKAGKALIFVAKAVERAPATAKWAAIRCDSLSQRS
jgi:hypothetical protein